MLMQMILGGGDDTNVLLHRPCQTLGICRKESAVLYAMQGHCLDISQWFVRCSEAHNIKGGVRMYVTYPMKSFVDAISGESGPNLSSRRSRRWCTRRNVV
jgi:hypothetical protein